MTGMVEPEAMAEVTEPGTSGVARSFEQFFQEEYEGSRGRPTSGIAEIAGKPDDEFATGTRTTGPRYLAKLARASRRE
jgi:hypothetical protein